MRTLLIALLFLLPGIAHAQGKPTADQLFQAGKASLARGDVTQACKEFAESQQLEPATGTLLNLADCEERAGHMLRALSLFQFARGRLNPGDFRLPFTDQRIAALTLRVPQLTVSLSGRVRPGLQVLRDGAEIEAGQTERVEVGKHVVIVKAPRRPDQRFEVVLAPGERRILDVELTEEKDPYKSRRTAAHISAAAGALGIVVGAVAGILTITAAGKYEDHCKSGRCDNIGLAAAEDGRRYELMSPIAFALGAAGIGTSVYLFLTTPPKTEAVPGAPPTRPSVSGIGIGGAF